MSPKAAARTWAGGMAAFLLTNLPAAIGRIVRPRRARGGVTASTAKERNAELVALTSRVGAANARHKARRLFASAERKERLDEEHMLRTATQVADTLGNMKGVLMKFAQMQSFINEQLPGPWKDALAKLQAEAPPMSAELAAEVVENELGKPPTELFAEWDPVPIAAASIGQVHRAITHDDVAVAVKVQYPGAANALTSDLANIEVFMQLAMKAAAQDPDVPDFDLAPIVAELKARITEEVDYRREADNQRHFADYFAGHPRISVPQVVDDLSTDRVLTTHLVEGARFAEIESWSQEERDLAGETVFRFVYHCIFRLGAYNGDPHPGNYVFRPGGDVTFLDFGLVKRVEPDVTAVFGGIFEHALVDTDPERFRGALDRAGFLKPGATVSTETLWNQMVRPWQALLSDEVQTMPYPDMGKPPSSDEEKELAFAVDLPPQFVILMRTIVGAQALLARMGARRNWRRIAEEIWPFTDGPASTPLGELESAWRGR